MQDIKSFKATEVGKLSGRFFKDDADMLAKLVSVV